MLHLDSLPQFIEVLNFVAATVCLLDICRLGSFKVDIVILIVQILTLNKLQISMLFSPNCLELDQARLALAQIILALHIILTFPLPLECILHHQTCV